MNQNERQFLLAVERGEVDTVKKLLERRNELKLDINCCDPLARDALIISINNENLKIIRLLLEAKIEIGDALMYAIDENFVEAVELLLEHQRINSIPPRQWHEDSFFSADMTPLTLAAHKNNFEIIKMLLDRRAEPIVDPHDPRCDCSACCRARTNDCLKHSRSRIDAYRALASPCMLALSSTDPLLAAFKMSEKLENLAKMEPEYKEDYLNLRSQCQKFATRLMDHTRTSKELEILLNSSDDMFFEDPFRSEELEMSSINDFMEAGTRRRAGCKRLDTTKMPAQFGNGRGGGDDDDDEDHLSLRLDRLKLAIQCKQKSFCAHPSVQELLSNMWYENLPGFRRKSFLAQAAQVICIGLMFSIYSIAYLVAPKSKLGSFIKKPFVKFICHSASYITFLVMLTLVSQRVETFYNWSSVVQLIAGLTFASTKPESLKLEHQNAHNATATWTQADNSETKSRLESMSVESLASYYRTWGSTTAGARGLDDLSKLFTESPASSKKRGALPSPIETIIIIWILALIWAEIKQIKALGVNYYKHDMWNVLDSIASCFYVGSIALRIVSYCEADQQTMEQAREHWTPYDPMLISEALFATATIFSALKLVYIFSLNPYLGPLQISLGRMIIDILRFSWIYMLVLFAFACGMNQLLWYYADLERHQCLNVTNYNLAQYYSSFNLTNGGLNTTNPNASFSEDSKSPVPLDDSCKTWRHFSNVFESVQTLFWANFGLVDLENFDLTGIKQYTRFWALLMFGCYCFINVIVVLNLLIAMMNHSYVKISKQSDIEWKFARTRLWLSYFDSDSTVPVPFNIVPSFKSIRMFIGHVSRRFCAKKWECEGVKRVKKNLTNPAYREVIISLVRRYLVHEQRLLEKKRELTEAKLNRWTKWVTKGKM